MTFRPDVAVFDRATGAIVHVTTKNNAPASTDAKLASAPLPAGYSEETWTWSAAGRAMVESAARVEAQLIAAIKDEAERRKMTMATPGGMKKAEYAEKRAEVMAWKALGANIGTILAALELLPMATRQTRFAHAIADSAAFGDKLQDAIGRFEKGVAASAPTVQVAAVEAKTCAAIRAATTATAKRAAAAAIVWPA